MIKRLLLLYPIVALLFSTVSAAQTTFYPASGIYNGFLDQLNIIECDNNNDQQINLYLKLFATGGGQIADRFVSISPHGSAHTIINSSIIDIKDQTGTYIVEIVPGQEKLGDKLNCRTAFYRNSKDGQKQFEYAYVLPVQNPQLGNLNGIYNSINPSFSGLPTANWLTIIGMDNSQTVKGVVQLYKTDGSPGQAIPFGPLGRSGRVDIPLGHTTGEITGTYTIKPDNKTALYDAFLIRYNPNSTAGYNYAFPSRSLPGNCEGTPLLASTMGNGLTDNWLEIANVDQIILPITIEVRDRFGSLLHSERRAIPPYGQSHLYLSPLIDPAGTGNVGSVRVICDDPNDRLITQSTFYGRVPGKDAVEWAYSSQVSGISTVTAGATLSVPFNTFVGMSNWLKLSDASLKLSTLDFDVYDFTGQLIASGQNFLPPGGTYDQGIHSLTGPNNVGAVITKSQTASAAFGGEVLRVLNRTDGQIGTVIQIPGIVQQAGIGGGSGGSSFIGNPQSLARYRDKLTREEASHLLTRTQFGASYARVNQAISDGLEMTIDKLMFFQDTTALDTECFNYVDNRTDITTNDFTSLQGIEKWWLCHLMKSPNAFKEKLALMWHDFFAASCRVVNGNNAEREACYNHIQVFRNNALGNYGQMLRTMTTDYMMLKWLNGNLNEKSNPDENYAREFHELFSVGESGKSDGRYPRYTETDIAEAARAFTGWSTQVNRINGEYVAQVIFFPSRHDDSAKTLYANTPWEITGNLDANDMVDNILGRFDTAKYVASRIFVTFCHDHPDHALVNQLAHILKSNNYEIKPLVQTVLESEACFSEDARNSRVKEGPTYLIGFLKQTGIPMTVDTLEYQLSRMGLEVTNPPTVFGWPMNRVKEYANTDYYLAWSNQFGNSIVEALERLDNDWEGSSFPVPIGYYLTTLLQPISSPAPTSSEVVDFLLQVMDVQPSQTERDAYISYMDTRLDYSDKLVSNPFDFTNVEQIRRKVGGVLWLISQHPQYRTY